LRQWRRTERGLQFRIERRMLGGRRLLGGLHALDGSIGGRRILVRGHSFGRRRRIGSRRRRDDEAIPLHRAIDLRKVGGLIAGRRDDDRIAGDGTGDVDALVVERCQTIGGDLR